MKHFSLNDMKTVCYGSDTSKNVQNLK